VITNNLMSIAKIRRWRPIGAGNLFNGHERRGDFIVVETNNFKHDPTSFPLTYPESIAQGS